MLLFFVCHSMSLLEILGTIPKNNSMCGLDSVMSAEVRYEGVSYKSIEISVFCNHQKISKQIDNNDVVILDNSQISKTYVETITTENTGKYTIEATITLPDNTIIKQIHSFNVAQNTDDQVTVTHVPFPILLALLYLLC